MGRVSDMASAVLDQAKAQEDELVQPGYLKRKAHERAEEEYHVQARCTENELVLAIGD